MADTVLKRAKKGKKTRKYDRNRAWCDAYKKRSQREINKKVKLRKHLTRHSGDKAALEKLRSL